MEIQDHQVPLEAQVLQVSQGQEVTRDYKGQTDSEVHQGNEEIQEELDSLDQLGIQDLVDKWVCMYECMC